MPLTMTTVTGPVYLPNGATPFGGRVSFELSSWDVEEEEGLVITGPVYVPIDENGQFSVNLFTTTAGSESVSYRVFVIWEDSVLSQSYVNDIYVSAPIPHYTKKYIGSFALSGPGPFQVSDLNIISETNNSSFDAYLEMKAFADRIDLGVLDAAIQTTKDNAALTLEDRNAVTSLAAEALVSKVASEAAAVQTAASALALHARFYDSLAEFNSAIIPTEVNTVVVSVDTDDIAIFSRSSEAAGPGDLTHSSGQVWRRATVTQADVDEVSAVRFFNSEAEFQATTIASAIDNIVVQSANGENVFYRRQPGAGGPYDLHHEVQLTDWAKSSMTEADVAAAVLAAIDAAEFIPYASGVFVPSLSADTLGSMSVSGGTRTGRYTRIGNRVFFNANLDSISVVTTGASGRLHITGLPFASSPLARGVAQVRLSSGINWQNAASDPIATVCGAIESNDNYVVLLAVPSAGGATYSVTPSKLSSVVSLQISGHYEIAAS